MDIIRKNIEAYDKTVDEYHEFSKDWHLDPGAKAQLDEFMSLVKKGKVLDLCCGPGRDAKIFSEAGFQVLGVDASPNMITKAKQVAPNADFKIMNLLALNLPSNYFDGVWFWAGLLVVPKQYDLGILRKVHDSLVAGGVLMMSVQEGTEDLIKTRPDSLVKLCVRHTKEEMDDLLVKAGFKIIKSFKPVLQSEYYNARNWRTYVCRKA